MTRDELRTIVLAVLARIAPEAASIPLDPAAILREELELDSIDFLNVVIGLHERLGIDIPEVDYPRLATLQGCLEYLAARMGPGVGGGHA